MKHLSAWRLSAAGFTLVEVAVAMGVTSFCLLAVMGLVPLGVNTGQVASDQTAAGSILTHVLADLRATPPAAPSASSATSTEYSVPIPSSGVTSNTPVVRYFGNSAQQFSFSPELGASRYRLTVTFLQPTGGRTATGATLLVSWPARVDPRNPATGTPTGRVQIYAALDRN